MQSRKCHSTFTAEFTRNFSPKVCFTIPLARQLSADNEARFGCFNVCVVVIPDRVCWSLVIVNVVSIRLLLFPDMSRHQSRNTRLTLSTSPASRSPSVEARSVSSDGSIKAAFDVQGILHCITWCPCTSAFMTKRWALHAHAETPAARSPRALGLIRIETWRPCCSQKSLASPVPK